jgi:hypothetical protein
MKELLEGSRVQKAIGCCAVSEGPNAELYLTFNIMGPGVA